LGRHRFEEMAAIVHTANPDDARWRDVTYQVFDLPHASGSFSERKQAIAKLLSRLRKSWVHAVPHYRLSSSDALQKKLDDVVAAGGEGLVLHKADALYRGGRSDDLLKLKPLNDAEAQIVGYVPGKGKYTGLTGALIVQSDGLRFRIGSGLSDAIRRQPPMIGEWITYRYRGKYPSGKPRFATYFRIRPAEDFRPALHSRH
jgi:DNA ligase-1